MHDTIQKIPILDISIVYDSGHRRRSFKLLFIFIAPHFYSTKRAKERESEQGETNQEI